MTPSPRDRLSVDLQGLKAPLMARAQAAGTSPSGWVRAALAQALHVSPGPPNSALPLPRTPRRPGRARLTLRMQREVSAALIERARQAGVSPGDLVADLLTAQPAPPPHEDRAALLAAVTASCAELSTLSRYIAHLVLLLRQGAHQPAELYLPVLAMLDRDVRRQLPVLTRALAALQPGRLFSSADVTPMDNRRRGRP